MVIGVDFDNTLVCYDEVFRRLALEANLIGEEIPARKKAIRDAIRRSPEGDLGWQRLQGLAYGPRIKEAEPAEGALDFLRCCGSMGVPVFVISHKTEFAAVDPTRTPLREAARRWLEAQGFFEGTEPKLHFGATRAEKIEFIRAAGCTHFIDDLEETFLEPDYPRGLRNFLYAPHGEEASHLPDVEVVRSWLEVQERIFSA